MATALLRSRIGWTTASQPDCREPGHASLPGADGAAGNAEAIQTAQRSGRVPAVVDERDLGVTKVLGARAGESRTRSDVGRSGLQHPTMDPAGLETTVRIGPGLIR